MTLDEVRAIEARATSLTSYLSTQERADMLALIAEVRRVHGVLREVSEVVGEHDEYSAAYDVLSDLAAVLGVTRG